MKPKTNLHQIWTAYLDSFKNTHALSVLQEAGQNSFDAYPQGTPATKMRVVAEYDVLNRTFRWRDFGTGGMGHCDQCNWGKLKGKVEEPCTNLACRWGCYHNAGYSSKQRDDPGGSRGMGKALQVLAGVKTVVRTTLEDGRSMASAWERKDDWEWELHPDLVKQLSPSGTEFETSGIVEKVHAVLTDPHVVESELQYRWFRPIDEGAHVEYRVTGPKKTDASVISPIKWPPLDTTMGESKAKLLRPSIEIVLGGKVVGELTNFHLFLAREPFAEDDRRAGIAIVKNGRQTITSFTDFPSQIPEPIRRRLFGYCDAICTDATPFLRDAENSTHTGYKTHDPIYQATKKKLREVGTQFTAPFLHQGGAVNAKQQKEAADLLDFINDILRDVPEFDLFGAGENVTTKPPRNWVYLSRVELENKSWSRGDTAPVTAIIKNPTAEPARVALHLDQTRLDGTVLDHYDQVLVVAPGTPEKPGTLDDQWKMPIGMALAPGIYAVRATLRDESGSVLKDNDGKPIVLRHRVYVETEIPAPKKRGKKENSKKGKGETPEKKSSGFSSFDWYMTPDLVDDQEAFIEESTASINVNLSGRRVAHALKHAKTRKGYWPVVIEVVSEEIMSIRMGQQINSKETWQPQEALEIINGLEENRRRLCRIAVTRLSKEPEDEPTEDS